jgi:hypothetical protein
VAAPPEISLKSTQWFPPVGTRAPESGVAGALVKLAVAAGAGAGFYLAHRHTLATVVWGIGGTLGLLSLASAGARRAIDGALVRVGRAVGEATSAVLLTLVYVLVVTPTRLVRRALGADDLHLRDAGRHTYWLPCDDEARKVRWVGSMFATEAPQGGGHPVRTALIVAASLIALAEGMARLLGFGHPVLYIADPEIGYRPEPNVDRHRYGGDVRTNSFGMRSPEVAADKPPGAFRIFMIGDSTLWGGSYLDQEDLYATVLRKHMNASGLPGPVEVLALGCNGWGPFHEHAVVRKNGAFHADLTLVQMPIDDVNRPLYGLMDVPFFAVQAPPHLALEEFANNLIWRYRNAHAGLDLRWERRQAQIGIREYGEVVADLQKAGSEVMVFVLPTRSPGLGGPEDRMEATWRSHLETTVAEHKAKTYFARGYFKGKGEPDEIYYDNVHLNPKGHHAYAEFIEARIREDSERFRAWALGAGAAPR